MKRWFDLTFRPFFVLTGAVTALGALNAFWPRWTIERIELIRFSQDYTIILQHWGILLGLMGVFMIVAAYSTAWRDPILIYSALEKAFFVYLVSLFAGLLGRRGDGCHGCSLHNRLLRIWAHEPTKTSDPAAQTGYGSFNLCPVTSNSRHSFAAVMH
jgi:hypothetical protein